MFKVEYLGGLRTQVEHLKSKTKINTDAPVDNKGKGEAFSPTDLVATALATCVITTIVIKAQNISVEYEQKFRGTTMDVKKIMSTDAPRRIVKIEIVVNIPYSPKNEDERKDLERMAHSCPVAQSLDKAIVQDVRFNWDI